LAEIDLGNSLIKEAVNQLKHDLPNIQTFVSLSPVPGFYKWLDYKLMENSESSVIARIMGKSVEW
jgi:malonyl-CoA decarboxylase